MSFLKNYTSQVPVSQTIYRIEQVLIKCGVKGITKEYAPDGTVTAMHFHIEEGDGKTSTVRMPAKTKEAQDALWLDYAGTEKLTKDGTKFEWSYALRKSKCRADFKDQAERTAWKIVQDWIEVQMSMIQMKQADHLEVFMPYIWNGKQTYYQALRERGFAGLLPEKSGEET